MDFYTFTSGKLPENTVFTGDGAKIHRESILSRMPGAGFADEAVYMLTAGMLAAPANEKLDSNLTVKEARPLYLRPTQAERMYKEHK